ncbi:MAG TPA: hypothetical protein VE135_05335 [Pyrinomonadaceae bacterium]|nr:hypothetical protein [Pyrinomonadaceae bacterium]
MQKPMTAGPSALLKYLYGCFLALSCTSVSLVHASEPPQLKTASSHPIQYYLSLPEGWVAGKKMAGSGGDRKRRPRVFEGCHSLRGSAGINLSS